MALLNRLLTNLPDGRVIEARIGLYWTAVVVDVNGETRCGLASTLNAEHSHGDDREPSVPQAGELNTLLGLELAKFALSERPIAASLGMAAINALLPRTSEMWTDANAEEIIAQNGVDLRVVMVGHFPFAERLRPKVGELLILEQTPGPGDLPAEAAPEIVPTAQLLVITGMTLTNHTLEGLLELRQPGSTVILMGPSTPLSPLLFDYGVTMLSGAVVTNIPAVLRTMSEGGNFRQLHKAGARLVNMFRPGL